MFRILVVDSYGTTVQVHHADTPEQTDYLEGWLKTEFPQCDIIVELDQ